MNIDVNQNTSFYQKIKDIYIDGWNPEKIPRNISFFGHYKQYSKSKDNNQKRKPKD